MMSPSLRIEGLPPIIPQGMGKAEIIGTVNDSTRFVMGVLAGELALPRSVTVKFVKKETKYTAEAKPGVIHLAPIALKYLDAANRYGHDAFMGIIAHELSHLSDFFTGTDSQTKWAPVSSKVIGEGKADHVGAYVGGEQYKRAFIEQLSLSERDQAYTDLFLSESRMYAARRLAEKHLKSGYETPLSRPCGRYTTGFALVEDVMKWAGTDTVFDVHAKPSSYFMGMMCANMQSPEARRPTLELLDGRPT